MRGKNIILKKIRQFYGGFKQTSINEQRVRYRSGIESLLWALGTPSGKAKDSYLDKIFQAGGRESDEPFERYLEAYDKLDDLNVFQMDYEELKKVL